MNRKMGPCVLGRGALDEEMMLSSDFRLVIFCLERLQWETVMDLIFQHTIIREEHTHKKHSPVEIVPWAHRK